LRRALVLGGGGVIGVAWETGIIIGLLEEGIDVRDADLVIGTSAGSMVGTRIAAGHDLGEAAGDEAGEGIEIPLPDDGVDMNALGQIFGIWANATQMNDAVCKEIGTLAAGASTAPEAAWIAATGASLGVDDWPEKPLRLTAVDVETGQFEVHTKETGAPLHAAIASSCAVPGMFPPIEIGGRSYMDGGVRSGTSADAALDFAPDVVLVIAPICTATAPIGAVAERAMNDEVAELRAAGAQVAAIIPLEAEISAFGPNLMDPEHAETALQAGIERGRALAQAEAGIWRD
jgi:NTE family protein